MASLSPDIVLALSNQTSWLTGDDQSELLQRVQSALETLPSAVSAHLVDQLVPAPDQVRAMLQTLALARSAGLEPVEQLTDGLVKVRDPEGHELALGTLCFPTATYPKGRPQDVERLTALLDATFQGRQYALYLRRPLPHAFEPGPVARAAHLWLAAIDRGEWKGRHAIYEDDDVALELTLVQRQAAVSGRVMTVGPVDALERLGEVDSQVVDLTQRHQAASDLPLVVSLAAEPRWRVPRGYVEQLLYGTADHTQASRGSYQATFTSNGRSLFSDPACASLVQLWWIEGDDAGPLAFRAWAHDNPWSSRRDQAPAVDVDRFHTDVEGDEGEAIRRLKWVRREPRSWQGA